MTQPDPYNSGRVSLNQLTPRLEEFDQIAASLFSGHDSMRDTPWVEPSRAIAALPREGLLVWCGKRWPSVRAAVTKRVSEAKRRMQA